MPVDIKDMERRLDQYPGYCAGPMGSRALVDELRKLRAENAKLREENERLRGRGE